MSGGLLLGAGVVSGGPVLGAAVVSGGPVLGSGAGSGYAPGSVPASGRVNVLGLKSAFWLGSTPAAVRPTSMAARPTRTNYASGAYVLGTRSHASEPQTSRSHPCRTHSDGGRYGPRAHTPGGHTRVGRRAPRERTQTSWTHAARSGPPRIRVARRQPPRTHPPRILGLPCRVSGPPVWGPPLPAPATLTPLTTGRGFPAAVRRTVPVPLSAHPIPRAIRVRRSPR